MSDISQLPVDKDERIAESQFNQPTYQKAIVEYPEQESTENQEDENQMVLLEHARKILEDDMKRRMQIKSNRQSLVSEKPDEKEVSKVIVYQTFL
jgi:hypothetical protein